MKTNVVIYHKNGSILSFRKARVQKTKVGPLKGIRVLASGHRPLGYLLKNLFGYVESGPRGNVTKNYHSGANPVLFQKVEAWTLAFQKRYIELIRKHARCSMHAICAIELDELHWLSKERDRLKYPISKREKAVQKKIWARVRKLLNDQNAFYRRK